jgi:hypothetical protein
MHTKFHVPTRLVAALSALFLAGTGAAVAQQQCFPHCDYNHYYGPYDFTYAQPGLFGYPRCGPQGDCAPHLAYTVGANTPSTIGVVRQVPPGRITVRLPRLAPRQP